MNKIFITLSVLIACTFSSSFAQITREQADVIVFQYIQDEVAPPYLLYAYALEPSEEIMVLTTHNEEVIEVEYACWAYYLNEHPALSTPCQHRYLFVKEDDGNLLEVITTHDLGPNDFTEWLLSAIHNATLSNLSVSAGELAPAFSSYVYQYTVNVVDGEEITITAIPAHANATVNGIGTFPIEIGENCFTIHVVAEDGITELNYTIVVNNLLKIKEAETSSVNVFPNPTTGKFSVFSSQFSVERIEIFDVYGRKQKAESRKQNVVDISDAPAGSYFVKIFTEEGMVVRKVVKQ